jgi:hypothetical protein
MCIEAISIRSALSEPTGTIDSASDHMCDDSQRSTRWEIPAQYRQPTGANGTRGSLCSCWDLFEVTSGDTSYAELNTTETALNGASWRLLVAVYNNAESCSLYSLYNSCVHTRVVEGLQLG